MSRAVILAAGMGSRLKAASGGVPKCLVSVGGTPLLLRHIQTLEQAGVRDITVVAGYLADQVTAAVPSHVRVVVNDRYATTNSLVSLLAAAPYLRDDAFVMQNADVLYSPGLMRRFLEHPAENACLVDADRPYSDAEYRIATQHGRIVRYARGLAAADSVGESAQLLKVGRTDANAFLDRIAEIAATDGATGFPLQAYPVLQNGCGLYPVYTARLPWWEVDTPGDLNTVETTHVVALEAVKPTAAAPRSLGLADIVARVSEYAKARTVPFRVQLMAGAWRAYVRHPIKALRYTRALWNQSLAFPAFELQVHGRRILDEVLDAAARSRLTPMLSWGSLLGAVRDRGFIRGDRDIDLAITPDDAPRLPAFRDALLARGYTIRIQSARKLSLIPPHLPTLFVDIDVLAHRADGWAIINDDSADDREFHYVFAPSVFAGTPRTALFAGRSDVRVPANAEAFLKAVYGDWSQPSEKVDYRYGPLNVEVVLTQPTTIANNVNQQRGVAPAESTLTT